MRRPGILPMYVLLWPLMSASSFTPPRDILMNFLPRAVAIDDAYDVFLTPGGPTKHNIGLFAFGFSYNSRNSSQHGNGME